MADNIYMQDGDASMMYYGEPPWHGLGQKLNHPATAKEAIEAARLDWDVLKLPLFAHNNGRAWQVPNEYIIVPEHRWGDPDCPVFAQVSRKYTPLQNREAFSFFGSEQESDGSQAERVLTVGEISVHSAVCETAN